MVTTPAAPCPRGDPRAPRCPSRERHWVPQGCAGCAPHHPWVLPPDPWSSVPTRGCKCLWRGGVRVGTRAGSRTGCPPRSPMSPSIPAPPGAASPGAQCPLAGTLRRRETLGCRGNGMFRSSARLQRCLRLPQPRAGGPRDGDGDGGVLMSRANRGGWCLRCGEGTQLGEGTVTCRLSQREPPSPTAQRGPFPTHPHAPGCPSASPVVPWAGTAQREVRCSPLQFDLQDFSPAWLFCSFQEHPCVYSPWGHHPTMSPSSLTPQ